LKKWNLIDESLTPAGKAITLWEHDGSYAIRVGAEELMSTRQHASEEKLAELACAGVKEKRRARVLVGGLGFGFTLRAVLAAVAKDTEVVVAELLGAVVKWNRDPALPLGSTALADRRVNVVEHDVVGVIGSVRGHFDCVILDVDNGPVALTAQGNAMLYSDDGISMIRASLRPGGCAAFWSAGSSGRFEKTLTRGGFTVTVERVGSHRIFLARR
jgi:spermidine synthase